MVVTPVNSAVARAPWLGQGASFGIIAATFALLTTGGTLPIPLYTLWGTDFGFGAATTTWVFAVYVFGTLLALVFFGACPTRSGADRLP